jgi:hypothetical protein
VKEDATRLRCHNWKPTVTMGDQGATTGCSGIGWIGGYRVCCMMSFCSQQGRIKLFGAPRQ